MKNLLLSPDSMNLLESADWLSTYVIQQIESGGQDREVSHRRAVQVVFLASQLLQATYRGPEPLSVIIKEATAILDRASSSGIEA
jgi:hypothetical protein